MYFIIRNTETIEFFFNRIDLIRNIFNRINAMGGNFLRKEKLIMTHSTLTYGYFTMKILIIFTEY